MEGLRFEDQDDYSAVARLLDIARNQTGGQARRVADFLLAWHNADENASALSRIDPGLLSKSDPCLFGNQGCN
jgi:hypothetical protein